MILGLFGFMFMFRIGIEFAFIFVFLVFSFKFGFRSVFGSVFEFKFSVCVLDLGLILA